MTHETHQREAPTGALLLQDLTLVFTDIAASTAKVEQFGNREWLSMLSAHHRIVRRRTAEFGGVESTALGDGFLLVFESLEPALRCVEAIQGDLRRRAAANPEHEIHVRVGIHTGETIVAPDGSLVGRDVHLASRVVDQADGGEVVVSAAALERGSTPRALVVGNAETVELRGLSASHELHRVRWT